MTDELKPCPFCGSAFKMGQEPHDNGMVGGMFYIYHDYGPLGSPARSCPISVGRHFDNKAEAIAAWNTRAPDPDDGELLTIAWMDGSHRSTKAHRETIRNLRETGDRLAGYAEHDDDCQWPAGPEHCTCGYSIAVNAWKELGE